MQVRALQDCYVLSQFRRGPEVSEKDEELSEGEVFEVPDDFVVNPDVFEVLKPPANGDVSYAPSQFDAPLKPPKGGKTKASV